MKLTHSEKDFISTVFSALNSPNQFCYLLNYVSKEILKSNDSFLEDEIYHYTQEQNKIKYYQQYKIKKKNGQFRQITAPIEKLKHLQSCLNIILQTIYLPHESAFGFIHNVSIVENAKQHTNREYVFNIDLKGFFASITADKVALFLQKPPFELKKQSSFKETLPQLIAAIASFKLSKDTPSALPQGSPLSPVLSNIVCQLFDDSLLNLAKRFNLTYSRYVDDISFSGDVNIFSLNGEFYQHLKEMIEQEGFLINTDKVRLQSKKWRQEVTGLVVNEKVNIRKKYVKELRMWLYLWETYGYDKASEIFHKNTPKKIPLYLILNGKLNFLRMIKGDDNSTYLVLQKRLLSLWPTENLREIKSLFQAFIDSLPKKDMAVLVSQFLQSGSFNQTESFQEFFSKSETLKKYKAELIPYANGMNFSKNTDGLLDPEKKNGNKVKFKEGLPFNFVGEWNQPVFTMGEKTIFPLNGEDVDNRDELRDKINTKLKQLKEEQPNFYDELLNSGSYFTAFSDQNGEVWIKPISLRLENKDVKIEEQLFKDGKITKQSQEFINDSYIITAYDEKVEGNLIKIRLFENDKNDERVNASFTKKFGNENLTYIIYDLNQEELKSLLNGTLEKKSAKLKSNQRKFATENGLSDVLTFHNISIVKRSSKEDRIDILTNGDYFVTDISNPVSIFQNVGFRLKFKEQSEDVSIEATISPSIVTTGALTPIQKDNSTSKKGTESSQAESTLLDENIKKTKELYKQIKLGNKEITNLTPEERNLLLQYENQELRNSVDLELKELEKSKSPVEELIESLEKVNESVIEKDEVVILEQETNIENTLQPISEKDNLQEIADYVWNNFTIWNSTKGYTVYELKENVDISELNRKFEQYKEAETSKIPNIRKNKSAIKNELLKLFFNSKVVKDYTKRGEIPSQRAFLE